MCRPATSFESETDASELCATPRRRDLNNLLLRLTFIATKMRHFYVTASGESCDHQQGKHRSETIVTFLHPRFAPPSLVGTASRLVRDCSISAARPAQTLSVSQLLCVGAANLRSQRCKRIRAKQALLGYNRALSSRSSNLKVIAQAREFSVSKLSPNKTDTDTALAGDTKL